MKGLDELFKLADSQEEVAKQLNSQLESSKLVLNTISKNLNEEDKVIFEGLMDQHKEFIDSAKDGNVNKMNRLKDQMIKQYGRKDFK